MLDPTERASSLGFVLERPFSEQLCVSPDRCERCTQIVRTSATKRRRRDSDSLLRETLTRSDPTSRSMLYRACRLRAFVREADLSRHVPLCNGVRGLCHVLEWLNPSLTIHATRAASTTSPAARSRISICVSEDVVDWVGARGSRYDDLPTRHRGDLYPVLGIGNLTAPTWKAGPSAG